MKGESISAGFNIPDAEQYARENPDCNDIFMDWFEESGVPEDEIRELIHFGRLSAED